MTREQKDRRKKNKRQKEKRTGKIERREKNDLKIYSPGGRLIYIGKNGFYLDYQELLRRKSKYSRNKHSF